ncbi:caspase-3 [Nothobranchius furzeri]|nr:caspase-3 [Nothobranchius furzeri]XP_054594887.1 caspase-3 [Nothobranchius furzeri]
MAEVSSGGGEQKGAEDSVDAMPWPVTSSAEGGKKVPASSGSKAAGSDPSYRYKMAYPSIGTCLIINNEKFHESTNMDLRKGTDLDADEVFKTFKKLGYNTVMFKNQKVEEMRRLLKQYSGQDHSENASFVCVLLSHGKEGVIYGTDGCEKIDTLVQCFKGHSCLSLVGKPKLFFIQACRGTTTDEGVETDSVAGQTSEKIPVEADFLYAYSTAPGYLAWRNVNTGSWFIQSLCKMLESYSGELELMQILTRVNNHVARHYESSSSKREHSGKKQIPCIVSMLTKEFHFSG